MLDVFPPNHVSAALSQVDASRGPGLAGRKLPCDPVHVALRQHPPWPGDHRRFEIGRIGESLGAPRINHEGGGAAALKRIIGLDGENGWFGFKTGVGGLIVGGAMGFLAAARERTVFIYLIRRDIVAQAPRSPNRSPSSAPPCRC